MSDKVIFRCQRPGVVKQQRRLQLRNFANSGSPASPQQKTGRQGIFSTHIKKGSSTVLFLFSRVGSCIYASHLRCQPSHRIVCLVKAYEHCHLVVVSQGTKFTPKKLSLGKDGGLNKCLSLFLNFLE